MATWSNWITKANEKNIPFPLLIDQPKDLERLYSSGLPCFDYILIQGKDYSLNNKEIIQFFLRHNKTWVRITNQKTKERFGKLGIISFKELNTFIASLNVKLNNFTIQLYEFHDNKIGGNIISNKEGVFIELIEGSQDKIERSKEPYFHGHLESNGELVFFEKSVPEEIIKSTKIVLNFLKLGRNDYLLGYFEFAITIENKVFFFDYKTSFG